MMQGGMKLLYNKKLAKDLSLVLRDLISVNQRLNYRMSNSIAPFTFNKAPILPIEDFIERLIIYSMIEYSTLISTFIYMDRFIDMCDVRLSINNIHKVFLTAMIISIKYNEDIHYKNEIFCKIGGISLGQLNNLEMIFLQSIGFQLFISEEEYAKYYFQIDYLVTSIQN